MKKVLALLLSAVMIVALAACGGAKTEETKAEAKAETKAEAKAEAKEETTAAPAEEKKQVRAAMILPEPGGAAWGECRKSFLRGCEAHGWEATFMSPTTLNSVPEEITLAENAISTGVDVLILPASDASQWFDTCTRALNEGIVLLSLPVAPINLPEGKTAEDMMSGYCGFQAFAVADMEAQLVADMVPKDVVPAVAYVHERVSDSIMQYNTELHEQLAKLRPEAIAYDMQPNQGNVAETSDRLKALKKANPEFNVCCGMNMSVALGIHNFVAEENLQGQFWGVGVDASEENLGTLKAGTVQYIIDQGYSYFGEQACDLAEKILNGEEVPFCAEGVLAAISKDNMEAWAKDHGIENIPDL